MKEKSKFRFYILLFSVAVFALTTAGLVISYSRIFIYTFPPVWLVFAYIVALALVFTLAYDYLTGEGKLSGKKFLLLTFSVISIATVTTHSVWTIVTPKWAFSVTTDKSIYSLGESVKITASLKNLGFIAHSFKSRISDPVWIIIGEYYYFSPVWWSPYNESIAEFSIAPNQSLERNFIWNQTKCERCHPEKAIEPGTYSIEAFIPRADSTMPPDTDVLFCAGTRINITI